MPSGPAADSEPKSDARVTRTRADVSRTALRLLKQEGYEALSHAYVAGVAGYSKTTLYTHWPSRVDLLLLALDSLRDLPHHAPTGDLRADLIGELTAFRTAVSDFRLDRILIALAQWGASDTEVDRVRERLVVDGERPTRELLSRVASGPSLDAAISMLNGVVICTTLMWGTLPSDEVIVAAVDIILAALPHQLNDGSSSRTTRPRSAPRQD